MWDWCNSVYYFKNGIGSAGIANSTGVNRHLADLVVLFLWISAPKVSANCYCVQVSLCKFCLKKVPRFGALNKVAQYFRMPRANKVVVPVMASMETVGKLPLLIL